MRCLPTTGLNGLKFLPAAAKAGLVAVPINFRLTAPEIKYIIENAGTRAILVEDVLAGAIEEIREDIDIAEGRFINIGKSPRKSGWLAYEDYLARASDREPGVDVSPDDAWCFMYTSGTTGLPKGAVRTHRGIAMLSLMTAVELATKRADSALLVMPMCHANSLFFFSAFLYSGASITVFSNQALILPCVCAPSAKPAQFHISGPYPLHDDARRPPQG